MPGSGNLFSHSPGGRLYDGIDLPTNTSDTLPDMDPTDGSIVMTEKYGNCTVHNQVWLYKLVGGKHDWPGSWGNNDFMASEEIWRFFRLFPE